jgi:hypothetical protein
LWERLVGAALAAIPYNKPQMTKAKKKIKTKAKKDSFVVRMKRRGHEFKNLGKCLANEPREFPRELLNVFRRSFRTIWDARGGGLYACGYVFTFVWLEIKMLVSDVLEAESVSAFFGAQIFEMFFRYLGESLQNMIAAFMWPVYIVTFTPPWGAIAFGLAYVNFDRLFKKSIEAWLFHDDEAPGESEPVSTNVEE